MQYTAVKFEIGKVNDIFSNIAQNIDCRYTSDSSLHNSLRKLAHAKTEIVEL